MILEEKLAQELWEEEYEGEDWEMVDEEEEYYKHSSRFVIKYFKHFPSNTFWAINYQVDYDYGADYDSHHKVEPVTVSKTIYKVVK